MSEERRMGFSTLAVHGSKHVDKHDVSGPVRSVSTPIFMSSTFAFTDADQGARIFAGEEHGYFYTRPDQGQGRTQFVPGVGHEGLLLVPSLLGR